jgi:phosphoribosylformylglycinamidine synthase
MGKVIDLWFEAPDREYATKELYTLSDRLLANTVIEDWSFELNEAD